MFKHMINEILKKRWSPYSFSPQPIEEDKLNSLFEAAGLAPSSNNEQPWLFIHVTREDTALFNAFLEFMVESNSVWAKNAWSLAISFARLNSSYNGKPNRYALHDTGMAVSNLLAQAKYLGLYVHQMGGYSVDKVKEYFRLRDDVVPVAMMAIGYLGDGTGITPELYARDAKRRGRNPVSEYSFTKIIPEKYLEL